MRRMILLSLVAAVSCGLGSCKQTPYRERLSRFGSGNRVTATMTDASQRAILSSVSKSGPTAICAEPSPDAISSLAQSASGAIKAKDKVSAEFAQSIATQMASIGLRTQSITLWRDEAFRICEGYLNGAITPNEFGFFHRRFQNLIIASMTIEQLTGVIRPTSVVVGVLNPAQASQDVTDAAAAQENAKKSLDDDTAKMEKAQAADDTNSTSDTKVTLANATAQVNADKGLVATTAHWHDNAVSALQQASASASNPTEPVPAAATSTVVAAATSLAIKAMDYDYAEDLCYQVLDHAATGVPSTASNGTTDSKIAQQQLLDYCEARIANQTAQEYASKVTSELNTQLLINRLEILKSKPPNR